MGKFEIILKPKAQKDFSRIEKSGQKPMIKKLEIIVDELSKHPKTGTGKPEKLKFELSGLWSRRLNKKDRLIYEIKEEPYKNVVIISALGHYE
ncbi:Txe/YoeB family addiction module toxin [Flavobacterium sp. CS20]|uniref:Txe/YoeB family addiction module toxin n=1 Tax=Flavobacterium sp. CS20 TaxID=2775246 RepID=UPI001B3A0713|nr:Txe/YoeB family addiction module toxin [Flavobacterium sp. CS20]QTY26945.1 Txe/YoeB family addiction module toxin [Flavobacterium sp. CS20]